MHVMSDCMERGLNAPCLCPLHTLHLHAMQTYGLPSITLSATSALLLTFASVWVAGLSGVYRLGAQQYCATYCTLNTCRFLPDDNLQTEGLNTTDAARMLGGCHTLPQCVDAIAIVTSPWVKDSDS